MLGDAGGIADGCFGIDLPAQELPADAGELLQDAIGLGVAGGVERRQAQASATPLSVRYAETTPS